MNVSYPQSTFEALLVETVNRRDYLKELVDALFIIEVRKLFKGLLDLLTKSLRLVKMSGGQREKIFPWVKSFWEKDGSGPKNTQKATDKAHCKTGDLTSFLTI